MYSAVTAQVSNRVNDFTMFVVVISLSFFIMAVFLVVIVINIYRQRVKNQKKVLDAIYATQENERVRIAEDLHDSIGANLSALKLRLDTIREDSKNESTSGMAGDSMELLDDVIVGLRSIIRNQTSKFLLANGFSSEMLRFGSYFSDHNKIKMEISIPDNFPQLKNNFGVNLFRIIQELVNNSVKHSQCRHIKIKFDMAPGGIKVVYSDDGCGFCSDEVKEKGMGLTNIDTRVKLYKGNYSVESEPGKYTQYSFVFNHLTEGL